MPLITYAVGDRVLVDGILHEVAEIGVNRFGGANYRLVAREPHDGPAKRWLTPRRDGSQSTVIDRRALHALVHAFYDAVRADEELAPVFARRLDDHWPEHLERMVRFWSSVLLDERSFVGNPMIKHRALDEAIPAHFFRWLAHFDATTARLFQPAAARLLQGKARAMARGLSTGMFGHPFDAVA